MLIEILTEVGAQPMTMCIWCDRFMNWGGQVTLLPDKRYQKAFRLKNEQLHKAGVCHRNIIAPINWHYSFTPLIICNCYYCSTCPALKWCILLGRSGLFIRRNGEIELKMPDEAGRWNYLMWQSFFKEFTFFFSHFLVCANKEANKRYLPVSQERSKKSEIP